MQKNNVKSVIVLVIFVIILIILFKFIIWLFPYALLLFLIYLVVRFIMRVNNRVDDINKGNGKRQRINNKNNKVVEGTIVREKNEK